MNVRQGSHRSFCFTSFSSKCSGTTWNRSRPNWDGSTQGLRHRGSHFHHHTCCCSALKSHQMNWIISSRFSCRASLWCFFSQVAEGDCAGHRLPNERWRCSASGLQPLWPVDRWIPQVSITYTIFIGGSTDYHTQCPLLSLIWRYQYTAGLPITYWWPHL